jgi:hypothetical protein
MASTQVGMINPLDDPYQRALATDNQRAMEALYQASLQTGVLQGSILNSPAHVLPQYLPGQPMMSAARMREIPMFNPAAAMAMRLRLKNGETLPFDMHIHWEHDEETAFVFMVKDGKAVVIEDSAAMFPSDTLITKINLLRAGHD